MEILEDLIKILLPAAVVLYAMYLTVRTLTTKDFEKKVIELKSQNTGTVLPLRLQAYERMCLFLERISPHNLVVRINNPAYNSSSFQQVLLNEIREEFNHNLSQQVYMSDQSWALIKQAMEETISIVNKSASVVPPDARSLELAKMIFENLLQRSEDPTAKALRFIKNEIRQVF